MVNGRLAKARSPRTSFIAILVAILVVAVLVGAALLALRLAGLAGDKLDDTIARLAGRDAIDCGPAARAEGGPRAHPCALAAFRARRPFRVRYDYAPGIDSSLSEALVLSPGGKLYNFFGDRGTSGGAVDALGVHECTNPAVEVAGGRERLECHWRVRILNARSPATVEIIKSAYGRVEPATPATANQRWLVLEAELDMMAVTASARRWHSGDGRLRRPRG